MSGSCPFINMRVDNGARMVDLDSLLCTPPVAAWTTLQALQAVSTQLNGVLSLGLYTED